MNNPITQKLELFTRLSTEDRAILDRIAGGRVRQIGAREDLIREGDTPRDIKLFLRGWACRYKQLEDGRRQIMAFFLPGDLCDVHVFILRTMDHSIAAITPLTVAEISRDLFEEITVNNPRIMQGLWWESLVNAAVQREWTVNLGQRSAIERISHLICEIFLRLRSVGLTQGDTCEWPITQVELADTTGMTSVHVSRTFHELRTQGLVTVKDRQLRIADLPTLMQLAMFNPDYLHLAREGSYLDANDEQR